VNPEIKAAWLAALRSGEYEQGKYALTTETESGTLQHCCLGVLCEIIPEVKATRTLVERPDGAPTYRYGVGLEAASTLLPRMAMELAGLALADPLVQRNAMIGPFSCLSYLNDMGNFTFAQIADAIEWSL
jgi:hypothetical protein